MKLGRLAAVLAAGAVVTNPIAHYLGVTRGVLEGSLAAVVLPSCAFLLLAAVAVTTKLRWRANRPDSVVVGLLILLWGMGLGLELGRGGESALRAIYLALPSIGVPVLLAVTLGANEAVNVVGRWVLLIAIVLCIGSLATPEVLFVPVRESYTPLRNGWFANPNMYGAVAMHGIAAYIVVREDLWGERRGTWRRIVGLPIVGVFLVSAVLSASRGSMVGALVTIGVAGIAGLRRAFAGAMSAARLAIGSIVVAGVFIVLIRLVLQHASSATFVGLIAKQQAVDLSSGRLDLWTEMLGRWWRERPFVGFGAGSATEHAQALGYSSSHNAYVRVAVESGLLGISLTFAVLSRIVWIGCKRAVRGEAAMLAVVVGLLVHSAFEDHLFSLGVTVSSVMFSQLAMVPDVCTGGKRELK